MTKFNAVFNQYFCSEDNFEPHLIPCRLAKMFPVIYEARTSLWY